MLFDTFIFLSHCRHIQLHTAFLASLHVATTCTAHISIPRNSSQNLSCLQTRETSFPYTVVGPRYEASCALPGLFGMFCLLTILLNRHVSDVARAFDVIVHKGVIGEIYNIGTSSERTVIDVAKDICAYFKRDPLESIEYVSDRLFNDRRYVSVL